MARLIWYTQKILQDTWDETRKNGKDGRKKVKMVLIHKVHCSLRPSWTVWEMIWTIISRNHSYGLHDLMFKPLRKTWAKLVSRFLMSRPLVCQVNSSHVIDYRNWNVFVILNNEHQQPANCANVLLYFVKTITAYKVLWCVIKSEHFDKYKSKAVINWILSCGFSHLSETYFNCQW